MLDYVIAISQKNKSLEVAQISFRGIHIEAGNVHYRLIFLVATASNFTWL